MRNKLSMINGLIAAVLLALLFVQVPAFARSASAIKVKGDTQRYVKGKRKVKGHAFN